MPGSPEENCVEEANARDKEDYWRSKNTHTHTHTHTLEAALCYLATADK